MIICLFTGLIIYFWPPPSDIFAKVYYCALCDSVVLDRQKFYEDADVIGIYTHKPIYPGHSLIIPKRKVARFEDLTDQEILKMGQLVKKVNEAVSKVFDTSAYILLQKNGVEAGQSVPQVHLHYIPRKKGATSTTAFLFNYFYAQFKGPISQAEMDDAREKIRLEMERLNMKEN